MTVVTSKYWVHVQDETGMLLSIRNDGTVEYGPTYTPERTKLAFEKSYGRPVIPVNVHGPAVEGTEIAVIKSIEPKKESE